MAGSVSAGRLFGEVSLHQYLTPRHTKTIETHTTNEHDASQESTSQQRFDFDRCPRLRQIQSPDNASTSTSLLDSCSSLRIASSDSFSLSRSASLARAVPPRKSGRKKRCQHSALVLHHREIHTFALLVAESFQAVVLLLLALDQQKLDSGPVK